MLQAQCRVLSLLMILMLAACGTPSQRHPGVHVVKAGETLYSIATRYGVDYRELARNNGVGPNYRIYVGQRLQLDSSSRKKLAGAPAIERPAQAPGVVPETPLPILNWLSPVEHGVSAVAERPTGGLGMTIEGSVGQTIRAAADGKVVYTGSGLVGFGQLIVIRHLEPFITAYGYTQRILVAEGDQVQAGQQIATMGTGPAQKPALYFEIRIRGRPVDPRLFLPGITH